MQRSVTVYVPHIHVGAEDQGQIHRHFGVAVVTCAVERGAIILVSRVDVSAVVSEQRCCDRVVAHDTCVVKRCVALTVRCVDLRSDETKSREEQKIYNHEIMCHYNSEVFSHKLLSRNKFCFFSSGI